MKSCSSLPTRCFYFLAPARHYSAGRFYQLYRLSKRLSPGVPCKTKILSRSVRDTENQTPASGKWWRHHSDPRNHRKTLHLDHLRDGLPGFLGTGFGKAPQCRVGVELPIHGVFNAAARVGDSDGATRRSQ